MDLTGMSGSCCSRSSDSWSGWSDGFHSTHLFNTCWWGMSLNNSL